MSSGTAAVLFDIDGTLVDSNYLHIHAWCRAFAGVGVGVESWRIHRSIGMDASELVKFRAAKASVKTPKSVRRNCTPGTTKPPHRCFVYCTVPANF